MRKNADLKNTLLVALFLLAALPSCAAQKGGAATVPATPAPEQPAQQPSPALVSNLAQMAFKSGVQSCAGRIDQMANFLTADSKGIGALLFIPPAQQDQRLISASLEIPATAKVPVAYVSTSVAPNQANGCGGMYESVIYWNQTCEVVAARNFGALKKIGSLATSISVLDGGIWTKIFLMPADKGCVSIKKEVVQ